MFYLIEITTYNNGTNPAKGVYSYDTKDEAVANFHSKIGGAMKNATYASELCLVIDSEGAVYRSEKWVRSENEVVEE